MNELGDLAEKVHPYSLDATSTPPSASSIFERTADPGVEAWGALADEHGNGSDAVIALASVAVEPSNEIRVREAQTYEDAKAVGESVLDESLLPASWDLHLCVVVLRQHDSPGALSSWDQASVKVVDRGSAAWLRPTLNIGLWAKALVLERLL